MESVVWGVWNVVCSMLTVGCKAWSEECGACKV